MLKPIPQEEPDKKRKRRGKAGSKSRKKSDARQKNTAARAEKQKSRDTRKKCVLTDTYNQLVTYTSDPNKHTDREISDIILSMHRSILHLEQARIKKRNKRRRK